MSLRFHSTEPAKIQFPIVPLLAVGFLLFFIFVVNMRLVSPEGSFSINLPISAPAAASNRNSSDIKVGLHSDREGNLIDLTLGDHSLGAGDAAFERLNKEILAIVGRPGNPLTKDIQVEIDADYETQYKYVVRAISKCTGRYDPSTKQIARYVEKIKFAPPHKPKD